MENTALYALFVQTCVAVRELLRHPSCTDRLRSVLTTCITSARNEVYEPREKPGDEVQTLAHLRQLTFGAQFDLEDDVAAALALPGRVGAPLPLPVLIALFAETVGQIAEHPDTVVDVQNTLCMLPIEFVNECSSLNEREAANAIWIRRAMPAYLRLFAGLSYLPNA